MPCPPAPPPGLAALLFAGVGLAALMGGLLALIALDAKRRAGVAWSTWRESRLRARDAQLRDVLRRQQKDDRRGG